MPLSDCRIFSVTNLVFLSVIPKVDKNIFWHTSISGIASLRKYCLENLRLSPSLRRKTFLFFNNQTTKDFILFFWCRISIILVYHPSILFFKLLITPSLTAFSAWASHRLTLNQFSCCGNIFFSRTFCKHFSSTVRVALNVFYSDVFLLLVHHLLWKNENKSTKKKIMNMTPFLAW